MIRSLRRVAFLVFGRLPRRVQRWVVGVVEPRWAVGTTGVVIHDGQMLLVRHSYKQGWFAPGGFINVGETAEEAAVREVAEEAGIATAVTGAPVAFLRSSERIVEFVVPLALAGGAQPGDARPVSAEIDQVAWFPCADLPPLAANTRRALAALRGEPLPEV